MHTGLIVLFFGVDLIVTAAVIVVVMRRRGQGLVQNPRRLATFVREMQPVVERQVRAEWNGDPAALAGPLQTALGTLEQHAAEGRLPLTRDDLKPLLVHMVVAGKLANDRDVREALRQVA